MNWRPAIDSITQHTTELATLQNQSSRTEWQLTSSMFNQLGWVPSRRVFSGMFGVHEYRSDGVVTVDGTRFVVEVKKVVKPREYGFLHAAVQGLIYHFRLVSENDSAPPILCIVLDWGRATGRELNRDERCFLDQFKEKEIYFVRLSFDGGFLVEHNLDNDWMTI